MQAEKTNIIIKKILLPVDIQPKLFLAYSSIKSFP